ncbi:MAG TPA: sigma-70 family RNA polymerase sigma factor [Solirubrobacteraceae bacterium]|nr:sigma-70 family RNA polymerase sigma factor [Solirubrobacteraceae bacterium]
MVTAGSDDAFGTLYQRHQRSLYRYCRSILRSETDAHDAVQSAFARAFEALRRDQRDAPLRPWLYRIAHNEAISVIRRRKAGEALSAHLTSRVAPTEDRAHDREQFGSLLEDLQRLPARSRGAILMRELSGLSHEEIATALGTSVNGAKQAIFEARTALSDFAEGRNMACEDVQDAISHGDRRVLRGRRVSAHLRDCPVCVQFTAEITGRRGRLRALSPPFSAGAAGTLLSRLARAGTSMHAGSATAGAGFIGNLAGSFSAVIVTAKGVLVAAALVVGLGAAGAGAWQQVSRPASKAAMRPASLIYAPWWRTAATTRPDVGAGRGADRKAAGVSAVAPGSATAQGISTHGWHRRRSSASTWTPASEARSTPSPADPGAGAVARVGRGRHAQGFSAGGSPPAHGDHGASRGGGSGRANKGASRHGARESSPHRLGSAAHTPSHGASAQAPRHGPAHTPGDGADVGPAVPAPISGSVTDPAGAVEHLVRVPSIERRP